MSRRTIGRWTADDGTKVRVVAVWGSSTRFKTQICYPDRKSYEDSGCITGADEAETHAKAMVARMNERHRKDGGK